MTKKKNTPKPVKVCAGPNCKNRKSKKIAALIEEAVQAAGAGDRLRVKKCACAGKCKHGPVVLFAARGLVFEGVKPKKTPEVLQKIIAALQD